MSLKGLHILLVEDEPIIGLGIVCLLEDAGATVEGPCRTVSQAMGAIEDASVDNVLDGAILDFRIGDEFCESVARKLFDNHVPLVLHTGSKVAAQGLADELSIPIVAKPSFENSLVNVLSSEIGKSR